MEIRIDFVKQLDFDVLIKILEFLDDPIDIIRASAVSRFWHYFVISNKISKKLCLQLFPQLSSVVLLKNSSCTTRSSADFEGTNHAEWEVLEGEHSGYAFLAQTSINSASSDCIAHAFSASTTDNFPEESIKNTLYPRDKVGLGPCYWSSKGNKNPKAPETLTYELLAQLCVIREFNIKSFKAYFQTNSPIYSAKAVRFRIGHPRNPSDVLDEHRNLPLLHCADDQFVWTYTSPEFPMDPDDRLQKFKLPQPVLCIGGYIQIELLGRLQRQEMDNLFYICVSHVKILGEPLFPKFDIEFVEPSGKFILNHFPENRNRPSPRSLYSQFDTTDDSPETVRALEHIFNMMHEEAPEFDAIEWVDDEDEDDNGLEDYFG